MIIGPDSELRKIPAALDPKQAFFIEGVRVCIEMIDFAHQRLQRTLFEIDRLIADKKAPEQNLYTSALLDAWSIVDSIHRLSDMGRHFPNVKHRKQIPAFHYLLKNS